MPTEFARDLHQARREAGYTQSDIGHLLDCPQSHVSALENGQTSPTLEQIISLSLIFGRSFEPFFETTLRTQRKRLWTRLATLREPTRHTAETFNRPDSIKEFRQRLREADDIEYEV